MIKSRRHFLKVSLATSSAPIVSTVTLPLIARAAQAEHFPETEAEGVLAQVVTSDHPFGPDRALTLLNVHTGERYEGPFWSRGRFVRAGMQKISHLLRDFRLGESMPMDPLVVDFMHNVYSQVDTDEPIQILSGYRSPETNARLARKSSDVAPKSLHMTGQAIDFRIPGTPARKLRNLAIATQRGGVGYYGESDFIHIDTGPVRAWNRPGS